MLNYYQIIIVTVYPVIEITFNLIYYALLSYTYFKLISFECTSIIMIVERVGYSHDTGHMCNMCNGVLQCLSRHLQIIVIVKVLPGANTETCLELICSFITTLVFNHVPPTRTKKQTDSTGASGEVYLRYIFHGLQSQRKVKPVHFCTLFL